MGGKTKIEWTQRTWNPIVGCSIVSPGCTNCYAMRMAARIIAMAGTRDVGVHYDRTIRDVKGRPVWTGVIRQAPEHILLEPMRRKKPTTYFVNSMGDLFHEDCPAEWIDRVFAVMALCPQHAFQVLTKRAGRMREYLDCDDRDYAIGAALGNMLDGDWIWKEGKKFRPAIDSLIDAAHGEASEEGEYPAELLPLPNVWLGVSCERQEEADERIPLLLQTPAAVRFISAEPLLGPIDLTNIQPPDRYELNALNGFDFDQGGVRSALDWVIVGGESGPHARPMHPDWARALRDQCEAAGVAFFFKQWGEWAPGECADKPQTRTERIADFFNGKWDYGSLTPKVSIETHTDDAPDVWRLGKKAAGRHLDGVEWNQFPKTESTSVIEGSGLQQSRTSPDTKNREESRKVV